jgi:hypothetical protein
MAQFIVTILNGMFLYYIALTLRTKFICWTHVTLIEEATCFHYDSCCTGSHWSSKLLPTKMALIIICCFISPWKFKMFYQKLRSYLVGCAKKTCRPSTLFCWTELLNCTIVCCPSLELVSGQYFIEVSAKIWNAVWIFWDKWFMLA